MVEIKILWCTLKALVWKNAANTHVRSVGKISVFPSISHEQGKIFPYIRKSMGISFPYLGIVWNVYLNKFLAKDHTMWIE